MSYLSAPSGLNSIYWPYLLWEKVCQFNLKAAYLKVCCVYCIRWLKVKINTKPSRLVWMSNILYCESKWESLHWKSTLYMWFWRPRSWRRKRIQIQVYHQIAFFRAYRIGIWKFLMTSHVWEVFIDSSVMSHHWSMMRLMSWKKIF